ncbi:MAG: hypothetical protein R6X06_05035 [Gammaproteobacteria bacterium]
MPAAGAGRSGDIFPVPHPPPVAGAGPYREALARAVEEWKKDPIEDEWLFERFRGEQVGCMSPEEAFRAIPETLRFLLMESDESTETEILQTLIDLARKSDTTEVPRELADNKEQIEKRFLSRGDYARAKLRELFGYYRMGFSQLR